MRYFELAIPGEWEKLQFELLSMYENDQEATGSIKALNGGCYESAVAKIREIHSFSNDQAFLGKTHREIIKDFLVESALKADFLEYAPIAFDQPYLDKWRNKARLEAYLKTCIDLFYRDSRTYYWPYITICQSSGNGKSRLFKELACSFPTIYLSLGKDESACYPKPTVEFRTMIQYVDISQEVDSNGNLNTESSMGRVLLRIIAAGVSAFYDKEIREDP